MSDTIKNARDKMRASFERADAHRQFVTMFTVSGMTRLAAWHEKQAASESHMAMFWSAIYAELSS